MTNHRKKSLLGSLQLVNQAIVVTSKGLCLTFALAVVVTIYDVILDVFFNAPTVWVYDVVTTLIAVAFLIGGSYALQRREHICITALYNLYPKGAQLTLGILSSMLTIMYLLTFSWFAWEMAYQAVLSWEVGGSVWRQPTPVVVKTAMFVGTVMMIMQAASNMLGDILMIKAED